MDARSGFLAVVLVALVAALAPRLEAREVRATETYLVPVLLRGHPYVISVSSSYSVDVDYASSSSPDYSPKDEAAASAADDADEDKVADLLDDFSSFVIFFDENVTEHEEGHHKHRGEESEDFIYLVAAEEDEDDDVDADEVVSSLFDDDADLYWLQEQIDLLSRFEASPSLDSVPRGAGGHYGRKNCNKGRRDWRHNHQHEDEDSWVRQIFHPSSDFGGPSANPFGLPSFLLDTQQDLYHPSDHQPRRPGPSVFSGEAAGGGAQPKRHPEREEKENVGRMVGMLILSISIICLYVVVIFGAIYMVLITMSILIQGCWRWCFGVRGAPEGYEALLDEDEDVDEREDADEEAPLPSSAIFSCAAVGVALSANTGEGEEETVHLLIHENPLVTTFDDVVRK